MRFYSTLLVFFFLVMTSKADAKVPSSCVGISDTIPNDSSTVRRWKPENQKLVASILAFPVPFGMLGLHRIYLGTEPWVPVVYTCTLGGAGILATIDFIAIITSDPDELKQYEHNPKVFMWVGTDHR